MSLDPKVKLETYWQGEYVNHGHQVVGIKVKLPDNDLFFDIDSNQPIHKEQQLSYVKMGSEDGKKASTFSCSLSSLKSIQVFARVCVDHAILPVDVLRKEENRQIYLMSVPLSEIEPLATYQIKIFRQNESSNLIGILVKKIEVTSEDALNRLVQTREDREFAVLLRDQIMMVKEDSKRERMRNFLNLWRGEDMFSDATASVRFSWEGPYVYEDSQIVGIDIKIGEESFLLSEKGGRKSFVFLNAPICLLQSMQMTARSIHLMNSFIQNPDGSYILGGEREEKTHPIQFQLPQFESLASYQIRVFQECGVIHALIDKVSGVADEAIFASPEVINQVVADMNREFNRMISEMGNIQNQDNISESDEDSTEPDSDYELSSSSSSESSSTPTEEEFQEEMRQHLEDSFRKVSSIFKAASSPHPELEKLKIAELQEKLAEVTKKSKEISEELLAATRSSRDPKEVREISQRHLDVTGEILCLQAVLASKLGNRPTSSSSGASECVIF